MGHTRLRSDKPPDNEGHRGNEDDHRNEVAGDSVGQPLDRRSTALGLGDQSHDTRQEGIRPDLLGAHDERPRPIDRGADDSVARLLLNRYGLAADHRLINEGRSFEHEAVDRHLLARPDTKAVPHLDELQRNVFLRSIGMDAACRLGGEAQESSDGGAGLAACSHLKHLTQENQCNDDGRRLEVDRDFAGVSSE